MQLEHQAQLGKLNLLFCFPHRETDEWVGFFRTSVQFMTLEFSRVFFVHLSGLSRSIHLIKSHIVNKNAMICMKKNIIKVIE